jgi:osmotically-inducible protein OsmY
MQKIKNVIIFMVLGIAISSCAAIQGKQTAGEYLDDTTITTKVKAAIFNDEKLRVFEISVETFKGEVQLRGFVDTRWRANEAERKARSIKGVKSVKNNIIVRSNT